MMIQKKQIFSRIGVIILFILFTKSVKAQDYKASLDGITKIKVTSETTIIIKSHKSDSLIIKDSENYKSTIPEKAKGLKSITSFGNDNTGYGVHISKDESILTLKGLRNRTSENLVLSVPKNIDISLEVTDHNDIYVVNLASTVEAKVYNGDIYFKNVTGPIVAENTVGEISIKFDNLNQSSPMSIVSMNGNIDISMPANAKVNLTAKVPRGEFFTDFDVNIIDDFEGRIARSIKTKLNGGGVELMLRTLKGNIYLRKNK